jgi:hypothetical protein
MRRLYQLAFGGFLVLLTTLCLGQTRPLAPWGVHAVATLGNTTYDGDKIRAVLVYSEIGKPEITLERIQVYAGNPSSNEVVWRTKIDLTGELANPCPRAESYCATVANLRWSDDVLLYELLTPSVTLYCQVNYIISRAPNTECEIKTGMRRPLS